MTEEIWEKEWRNAAHLELYNSALLRSRTFIQSFIGSQEADLYLVKFELFYLSWFLRDHSLKLDDFL